MSELPFEYVQDLLSQKMADADAIQAALAQELAKNQRKIVVLDDDPTGVQTVNGIYVYTDWEIESIRSAFADPNKLFFILTNSRGLTAEETTRVHSEIAERLWQVSRETGQDFILISRSDSTLRGHYPLETETLRQVLEQEDDKRFDGEVIYPFFLEGGRYTIGDTHYVSDGKTLVPAGNTEFARDKSFGYKNSHLGDWVEEKTNGAFTRQDTTYISLDELNRADYAAIEAKLMAVDNFRKVIVNSIGYDDVKVFVTALLRAIAKGKRFVFRSAAALPKILGNVSDKPLLTRQELCNTTNRNGGLIVVGSHVNKTTDQLHNLLEKTDVTPLEFNQHLVMDDAAFEAEIQDKTRQANELIAEGKTVALYTRRERFDLNTGNKEDELRVAVKISNAVTSIVANLKTRPNFIIAKGGITSSEVGTKALRVQKAIVMGQIVSGVPVWLTGPESKFPDMPYVIFPGNVGTPVSLVEAYEKVKP